MRYAGMRTLRAAIDALLPDSIAPSRDCRAGRQHPNTAWLRALAKGMRWPMPFGLKAPRNMGSRVASLRTRLQRMRKRGTGAAVRRRPRATCRLGTRECRRMRKLVQS